MEQNIGISLRIKMLVTDYAGGNNSKFAHLIGTSEANVRNYLLGTCPKIDIINSIVRKFEINYEWLLAGTGPMRLKNNNEWPDTSLTVTQPSNWINCPICNEKEKVIINQEERIKELKETIAILRAQVNASDSEENGKLKREINDLKKQGHIAHGHAQAKS